MRFVSRFSSIAHNGHVENSAGHCSPQQLEKLVKGAEEFFC